MACYFPIEHLDAKEAFHYVEKNPKGSNVGVNVSDNYITRLNKNEPEANALFQDLCYSRLIGKGYIHFVDRANRALHPVFKKHNLEIKGSNLCVAPETQILTKFGYIPIAELEGQKVSVWNGEEWSETVVKKTSDASKLLKVTTSAGHTLDCTEYHKWYVFTEYGKPFKEVRTKDLKVGDKLIKFDLPVVEGGKTLKFAYDNGFFSGDGCAYNGSNIFYLYHEKNLLAPYITSVDSWNKQENQKRWVGYSRKVKQKFFVPTEEYSIDSRLEWLAGFLDADGCVYRNGSNEALTASSVNFEFLKEIQLMLQTLGVSCKISVFTEEGYKELPANDGTGENKEFYCQKAYRLLITSYDTFKLYSLGLNTHRLSVEIRQPQRDAKQFNKVEKIEDLGRVDETFCFTEKLRGMGMFNGILTGQCSEIELPSNEEYSFTCCLSSLNLLHYDNLTDDDIFYSLLMLDCVNQDFVANCPPELHKVKKFAEDFKALGLGVMGLATYLQNNGVVFDSLEAKFKNQAIFKRLSEVGKQANKWMYELLGTSEYLEEYGIRNSTQFAVAPTLSTAIVMGGVSEGIEPIFANTYIHESPAGDIQRASPWLVDLLKSKGKWNKEVLDSVVGMEGSIAHLDFLTAEEKALGKTAYEQDQYAILRMAEDRAQYLDQGQSVNGYFNAFATEREVGDWHRYAFNDCKYLKALYYIRAMSMENSKIKHVVACESCAS